MPHEAKAPLELFSLQPNMILVEGKIVPEKLYLMRQNRQSLLAFPKLNKAVSISPHETKALWSYFAIRRI